MIRNRRRALALTVLSVLLFLGLALGQNGGLDGLQAGLQAEYQSNLTMIARLQKNGDWSPNQCSVMMSYLTDNQKLASRLNLEFNFHFEKDEQVLRKQNFLVQNMHDFLTTMSLKAAQGADHPVCLLVIGKTPLHPEFAGLFLDKVSDRDVTYVGTAEAEAISLHLKKAQEYFREGPFAGITLMELAQGGDTIARTTIDQFDKLATDIAISPEMHRTYSGMQFVQDYVMSAGEIQTLDADNKLKVIRMAQEGEGELAQQLVRAKDLGYKIGERTSQSITLTRKGFTPIEIVLNKNEFIKRANQAFTNAGSTFRFSIRPPPFALGLVSDIDAQLRLNLGKVAGDVDKEIKEAGKTITAAERDAKIAAKKALIYKKYGKRYSVALKWINDELAVDPKMLSSFNEKLNHLVETNPDAVPGFINERRDAVVRRVSAAQIREYHKALEAGDLELAAKIKVDSRGAMHNFGRNLTTEPALKPIRAEQLEELFRPGPPHVLEGGAESSLIKMLGRPVLDAGDELMAGHSLPHAPRIFSRTTMLEYFKQHPKMTALQIGSNLFTFYEVYEQYQSAIDPWQDLAWLKTLAAGGANFVLYDAIPAFLEMGGYEAAAGLFNGITLSVTVAVTVGVIAYDYISSYLFNLKVSANEMTAFGGVTPDGRETNVKEFFHALGVPLTREDLAAPGEIKLGTFADGKVIRSRDGDGNFVFKSLQEQYRDQWDRGDRASLEGFFDERMKWNTNVFSPGQLIVTRLLDRAYDKLRPAYLRWAESKPAHWNDYYSEYADFKGHNFPNVGAALSAAEFDFYERKFQEAWENNWARTQILIASDDEKLSKEIREKSYLQFMQAMIQHGFENKTTRVKFERAGPIELEGWIKVKMPVKFDGHLWTEAELQAELQRRWAPYYAGSEAGRSLFIPMVRERFGPEEEPAAAAKPGLARVRITRLDIQRGTAPVRTAEGHPNNNGAGKPVYAGERCLAVLEYVVDDPGTGIALGYLQGGKRMWLVSQLPLEAREDVHLMWDHQPGGVESSVSNGGSHRVEVAIDELDVTKKQYDFIIYGWQPGPGDAKPTRVEIARQSLAIATFPRGWALAEVITKGIKGDRAANTQSYSADNKLNKSIAFSGENGRPLTMTFRKVESSVPNRFGAKYFEIVDTETAVIEGIQKILRDGEKPRLSVTHRMVIEKDPADAEFRSEVPDLYLKITGRGGIDLGEQILAAKSDEFKTNGPPKELPYTVSGGSGPTFDLVIVATEGWPSGDSLSMGRVQQTIILRYRRLDGKQDAEPLAWSGSGGVLIGGGKVPGPGGSGVTGSGTRNPDNSVSGTARIQGGDARSGTGLSGNSGTGGSRGGVTGSGTVSGSPKPPSVPSYVTESDCTKGRTPPPTGLPAGAGRGSAGRVAQPKPPAATAPPAANPADILKSPRPWENPLVRQIMNDWLHTSEPAIRQSNPTDTRKWRWTEWGVAESPPSVTALHPDNGGMTRDEYIFTLAGRLISQRHYSLREYLERRLHGESGIQLVGQRPTTPIKEALNLPRGGGSSPKPPAAPKPPTPAAPPAPVGSAVGNRAPEVAAEVISPDGGKGPSFAFSAHKGKVVLLSTYRAFDDLINPGHARYLQELDRIQKSAPAGRIKAVVYEIGGTRFMSGDIMQMAEHFEVPLEMFICTSQEGFNFKKEFAVTGSDLIMIIDQNGVIRYRADTREGIFSPEFRATLKKLLPDVDWAKVFQKAASSPKK